MTAVRGETTLIERRYRKRTHYRALRVLDGPARGPASSGMSLPEAPAVKKKLPVVKLALVGAVILIGAVILLRGVNPRALIDQAMALIREQGPVVFFTAMALLPCLGFPVLAFGLTAGPAFSDRLGMPTVVICALVAVTVNFLLTYALARRALRPVLQKLLTRFGYKLPQVEAGDAGDLVVILRLTPGIPFFVQNYLAGLAEVKFSKYFWLSCVIVWPMNAAVILFADALAQGRGKFALIAGSAIIAIAAATHLARKHYGKKQKAPTA
jgi:uncharacterized membrane protein YdjX (TVP38/TMEM64 family)